jgi:hypothetical protein
MLLRCSNWIRSVTRPGSRFGDPAMPGAEIANGRRHKLRGAAATFPPAFSSRPSAYPRRAQRIRQGAAPMVPSVTIAAQFRSPQSSTKYARLQGCRETKGRAGRLSGSSGFCWSANEPDSRREEASLGSAMSARALAIDALPYAFSLIPRLRRLSNLIPRTRVPKGGS